MAHSSLTNPINVEDQLFIVANRLALIEAGCVALLTAEAIDREGILAALWNAANEATDALKPIQGKPQPIRLAKGGAR